MNKQIITQNEILKISKNFILDKGFVSFNIRTIAKECGISVGTIYNYFPSKSELIIATVESVWKEIFEPLNNLIYIDNFIEVIKKIYETIKNGNYKYPEFFSVHSLSFASEGKDEAIKMMNFYFYRLKEILLSVLRNDKCIKEKIFNDSFSDKQFVDYIFTLILSSLLNEEEIEPLLIFISNYIY